MMGAVDRASHRGALPMKRAAPASSSAAAGTAGIVPLPVDVLAPQMEDPGVRVHTPA